MEGKQEKADFVKTGAAYLKKLDTKYAEITMMWIS